MEQNTLQGVLVIDINFQTIRMLFGILKLTLETINLKPQRMGGLEQCWRVGQNCRKVPIVLGKQSVAPQRTIVSSRISGKTAEHRAVADDWIHVMRSSKSLRSL